MSLMNEFNRDREFTFSGTVDDRGRERRATFSVLPSFRIESGKETQTVTFVATGDPFAGER
jgi:hypothetical protein